MGLNTYRDAHVFLRDCRPFLESKEVENSLLLGLAEKLSGSPASGSHFLAKEVEGRVRSAALKFPGRNLILTEADSGDLRGYSTYFFDRGIGLEGVVGPQSTVERFVPLYYEVSGQELLLSATQIIYQLSSLAPLNTEVSGRVRSARQEEFDLLFQWQSGFLLETSPRERAIPEDIKKGIEAALAENSFWIWEDQSQPVAMARWGRPTRKTQTITHLYTPAHFRKRGYATALTHAVTGKILNSGKHHCVLYADARNAVANRVYKKLGFVPAGASLHYLAEEG